MSCRLVGNASGVSPLARAVSFVLPATEEDFECSLLYRRQAGVWLFASQTADGLLQFSHSCLCCIGSVLCIVQRGDVLTGVRVIPAKLTVFPTEVQVENFAVSLQTAFGELFDGDGLVLAVD